MDIGPDPKVLKAIMTEQMPFGKYQGRLLYTLPEHYLVWFKQKGFPKGKLGIYMETVLEIRVNGLEYLFEELRHYLKN